MSNAHKILVADDSLTIRKLVESILTEDGYQVMTVTTGGDCLKQAGAEKPSLILLDYILPDMQGTEICRSLINSPETWEIPVLMMSSNGNAIRQLYQDLNNVSDYLTKPFAPSVLKAVVGHLLQKDRSAEASGTHSGSESTVENGVSKDFAEKVNRLLGLMENQMPASETSSPVKENTPLAGAPAGTTIPPKKTRRVRKAMAAAPAPDSVLRKIRLAMQKHLRVRLSLVPEWESGRGTQEPVEFYLNRLLPKDVVFDLGADLLRASGIPADVAGALRCPVELLPLDGLLQHLQASRATGELRVETEEETVLVGLESGEVVMVTTNHPRNYCAGAAFDFQAVPHPVISEAVRAQEEQNLPFFTSLKNSGHLPAEAVLEDLLRSQGTKCLCRAYKSSQAVVSFFPLAKLSALARASRLEFSLNQLLLACYRTIDDWFTLEKVIRDMEATLVPDAELDLLVASLQLEKDELLLLEAIRPGRNVPELAAALKWKPYEVCLILFRFLKLGLVRPGIVRPPAAALVEKPVAPAAADPIPSDPTVPVITEVQAAPEGHEGTAASVTAPETLPVSAIVKTIDSIPTTTLPAESEPALNPASNGSATAEPIVTEVSQGSAGPALPPAAPVPVTPNQITETVPSI